RGLNLTFEVREGIIKHSHFQDRDAAREFDPSTYPCLEAQIVDLADEIAYLAHDVDDGIKAGMLTMNELAESRLFQTARAAAQQKRPTNDERIGRYQAVIRMIDLMVTDLVATTDAELTRLRVASLDGVRHAGRALASFSGEMDAHVRELKLLMNERLYRHYRVLRMTEKAGRVLARLFETYMAEPRQMPPHTIAAA